MLAREGIVLNHKKLLRLSREENLRVRRRRGRKRAMRTRGAREFGTILPVRGKPLMIVSGNGTKLTSLAVLRCVQDRQIKWH